MGFGDLKVKDGQQSLNDYLADKSYIEGYEPSQADVVVFQAVGEAPSSDLAHALRWYNHILSYGNETAGFSGEKKPLSAYGPPTTIAKPTCAAADDDDDDDDDDEDLFGSDTEEQKEAAEKLKEERIAAYNAKKAKKPAAVAKSSILLDVKPWDDETDMVEMERLVRSIEKDGLLWGASKLIPLAYGVKKLQIACVVEDDKISTDDLEEEITKFQDYVQSMDIAAFNKV